MYQIEADNNEINKTNVAEWLRIFQTCILPERQKLGAYYMGKNKIEKQGVVQGRPNYSINVNMAKYITDVATGYFIGKPATYEAEGENTKSALDKLMDINKNCRGEEIDSEVASDMSIYGVGYQLLMVKEGQEPIEQRIVFKRLSPLFTFYVTDNTILRNPLCAIYYYTYFENKQTKNRAYVYDNENLYIFDGFGLALELSEVTPHNMGQIPLLQTINNDKAIGDYFSVVDLLDSLSLSLSNNTDDLQSIANAILAASGGTLNEEQIQLINQYRTANLPVGADMKWVVKDLNPDAIKDHVDRLMDFIFQISLVPDLTDDAFAGNLSGVAMEFKMWGIDQLWTAKERKYKTTLYKRIKMILHLLQYQIKNDFEFSKDISITFYKNLPQNMQQDYDIAQNLAGVISLKTLLKNISIVKDVDKEIEQIHEDEQRKADTYGFNTPINNKDVNDDGKDE